MNEHDFIRRLREQARSRRSSARLVNGIGDDAAVIDQLANTNSVITTDLLIEDIDFRLEATTPQLLGRKALAVSLSDIAAMGARPLWSLLSIGMPQETWAGDFKDKFFEGYFALADQFGVTLAGGDVSRTPDKVVIDSIVVGEVGFGQAVLRSGARPGDQIYVTGSLGAAAAGLRLLEMGARLGPNGVTSRPRASKRVSSPTVREGTLRRPGGTTKRSVALNDADSETIEQLLRRQLCPAPRVGWGIVLGEEQLASSMIDMSDGLSSDLAHLCGESNVGALIQCAELPVDKSVVKICGRRALDPLLLALHGGEDFELLFTVAEQNVPHLPKQVDGVAISHIGEITDEPGKVRMAEKNRVSELKPGGFDHFKARRSGN